jgi:hypothetical protein
MSIRKLEIVVPQKIWDTLEKIEHEQGIRKEDILMRALVKVLEEFKTGG